MARRTIAVFVAVAAADTLMAATGHDRRRWLTKPLLMPVLMVGRDRLTQRALALGAVGDVALLGSSETAFTAGLVSFLAGHIAWIIALGQRPGGGGALFLVSDALLALEKFGGVHLPAHEGLVMAAYTSAQALLAG